MKTKNLLLYCLLTLTTSCSTILIKTISKNSIEKDVKVLSNRDSKQTIVFLPVVHVGKENYYDSFKPIIDSLRRNNYQIFYESVAIRKKISDEIKTIYEKKFRKILGFHLDTTRNSYLENRQLKKYLLQDYKKMGITSKDIVLDLGIDAIIDSLEIKYGKIKLSECDIATPLAEKYNCKNSLNNLSFDALHTFRENHIFKYLKNTDNKKIVLIYGKSHWYFLYAKLNNIGFEIVKGKL